ncbi:hypothetical protein BH11MYX1_BH11MYX1_39480 [soil metagenome]
MFARAANAGRETYSMPAGPTRPRRRSPTTRPRGQRFTAPIASKPAPVPTSSTCSSPRQLFSASHRSRCVRFPTRVYCQPSSPADRARSLRRPRPLPQRVGRSQRAPRRALSTAARRLTTRRRSGSFDAGGRAPDHKPGSVGSATAADCRLALRTHRRSIASRQVSPRQRRLARRCHPRGDTWSARPRNLARSRWNERCNLRSR